MFSEFQVAHSIFGGSGIVLSIDVGQTGDMLWDCNYWSCYQNENERVFLGGLNMLEFTTIRDIPLCINYEPYIKILKIFDCMIAGYALPNIQPKARDFRGLLGVIDCVINDDKNNSDNGSISIPSYIIQFFKHCLMQKKTVLININDWRYHKGRYWEDHELQLYGFLKNRSNFFTLPPKKQWDLTNSVPKLSIYIQAMLNLEQIVIYSNPGGDQLEASISLSEDVFSELLDQTILINSMSSTTFESIQIVEPFTDADTFINKYNDQFNKHGWTAIKSPFEYVPFGFKSNNSLMIKKV